jgi:hypothetical protein
MTKFTLRAWRDGGCPETYKIACELGPELRVLSPSLLQRHSRDQLDLARWFIARMEFDGLVESFDHPNGGTSYHGIGAPWEIEHKACAPIVAGFPKVHKR